MALAGGGRRRRRRRRNGRPGRFQAPQADSFDEEVADGEAVPVVVFDLDGELAIDAGEFGMVAAMAAGAVRWRKRESERGSR